MYIYLWSGVNQNFGESPHGTMNPQTTHLTSIKSIFLQSLSLFCYCYFHIMHNEKWPPAVSCLPSLLFRTEILHHPAVSQRSLKQASPCFPVTSHAALAQQRFAATIFFPTTFALCSLLSVPSGFKSPSSWVSLMRNNLALSAFPHTRVSVRFHPWRLINFSAAEQRKRSKFENKAGAWGGAFASLRPGIEKDIWICNAKAYRSSF